MSFESSKNELGLPINTGHVSNKLYVEYSKSYINIAYILGR